MVELKISIILTCMICKALGEIVNHNFQRFVMPIILAVGICLVLHSWWLGLLVLPMIAPLCMGYKTYGKSDGFDRAVWLLLICVVAGLGLCLLHHLAWYFYVPYCILGAVWGGVTRMWWNVLVAPVSGLLIGSLIFLVK